MFEGDPDIEAYDFGRKNNEAESEFSRSIIGHVVDKTRETAQLTSLVNKIVSKIGFQRTILYLEQVLNNLEREKDDRW